MSNAFPAATKTIRAIECPYCGRKGPCEVWTRLLDNAISRVVCKSCKRHGDGYRERGAVSFLRRDR